MIRIFDQAFDYGDIFSKSQINMGEDKNENYRMEIVKKDLVFAPIQYAALKFRNCKIAYQPFLLLVNLYFQVVSVLVKTRLLLNIRCPFETFHKSLLTIFLCVKFLNNTSKFVEVIDPLLLKYGILQPSTKGVFRL